MTDTPAKMKLNKTLKTILLVVVSFAMYLFGKQFFAEIKTSLDELTNFGLLSYFLTYLLLGIPLFIAARLISPEENIFRNLGLSGNMLIALGLACFFALPMFIGGFFFFQLSDEFKIENLIAHTIVIGFIEELYYRGFLFGQFFKHTKLGFIPAILLGAILFASGHLYQSQDPAELMGIFAVTFMGAVLFAWLYVEWNYNLWVPIFLHALMNMSWEIFNMDDSALGGLNANVFRALTIALAIVFTLFYKIKRGKKIEISRKNVWMKKLI